MDEIAGWYSGRRVVVTGCASGIGAALAHLLCNAGADVIGLDYRRPTLASVDYRPIDLRDPHAVLAAADAIDGAIDGLFNCAGIAPEMGFEPHDVFRVNFFALRSLSEALLPKIADGGAITSIASFAGRGWRNNMPAIEALLATKNFADADTWIANNPEALAQSYNLSKEAVIVWTMREAGRTMKQGVRMNATSPGPVRTALMDAIDPLLPAAMKETIEGPMGRYTTAEEQAVPLFFLGSGAALAVNGIVLPVDGGQDGQRSANLA